MNHVSIFEKKWLDLVFEGKNKAYGAYQLRRENTKTTLFALLLGLLLLTSVVSIGLLAARLSPTAPSIATVFEDGPTVTPVDLTPQPPHPKSDATPPVVNDKEPQENTTQLRDPEIVSAGEAPDTNLTKDPVAQETPSGTGISGENPTAGKPGNPGTPGTAAAGAPESDKPAIPGTLDKMPTYPGGMENFYRYVGNHFNKPDTDDVKTITVIVMFVIEKDGSITDVRVARDPGYGMAKEATRVLKSMKEKWTPGIKNGQPVRTAYSLPITVNTN